MLIHLLAVALVQDAPKLLPPEVLFAREVVDHRPSQSPVKDQGARGTCAAFAMCGALEAFPGVPTDLCEQLLYATVKLHEQDVDRWIRALGRSDTELTLSEGDSFREYLPLFSLVGTCHESFWPYDPRAAEAGPRTPPELKRFLELARLGPDELRAMRDAVGKWGFRPGDTEQLNRDAVRDVARLKGELRAGTLAIPVGYTVHGSAWSKLDENALAVSDGSPLGQGARIVCHPGMLEHFADAEAPDSEPIWLPYAAVRRDLGAAGKDLVTEIRGGRWLQKRHSPPSAYGGHAVLLVGFTEDGFIAKNSWGEEWGAAGYCVISYDYHRLHAQSGLLLRAPSLRPPIVSPFENRRAIEGAEPRLKVQSRVGPGRAAELEGPKGHAAWIVLSTWFEDTRDPNVEVVEYIVEAKRHDGKWREQLRRAVLAGPLEERHGAPLVLDAYNVVMLSKAPDTRVRVRYGVDVLDPSRPSEARFLREAVFGPLPHWGATAIDLAPQL